jgi:CubicO group peptidase (beta-lactamase class C family)
VDPEKLGWSARGLDHVVELAEGLGLTALMIVQYGLSILQWGEVSKVHDVRSVRKALSSILYGRAVDAGKLQLSATLAQLNIEDGAGDNPPLTKGERSTTLLDVLKCRSGVYLPAAFETFPQVQGRPVRGSHSPGTYFWYNNWDFNLMQSIYERVTGNDLFDAFNAQVAQPLMMQDFNPNRCIKTFAPKKSFFPAMRFFMSARDLARVGLLMSRDGRWGHKRVVSRHWVRSCTTPYSDTGTRGFGYHSWFTGKRPTERGGLFHGSSYHASGARGQRCHVEPASDLVIVTRLNPSISGGNLSTEQFARLVDLTTAASPSVSYSSRAGMHI